MSRTKWTTSEGVRVVVLTKDYPSGSVVGLGVGVDGGDLTAHEAKTIGEALIRAAAEITTGGAS